MTACRRGGQHVRGTHPSCEQRLVGIAHRRVSQQDLLLLTNPLREAGWPLVLQQLASTLRRTSGRQRHLRSAGLRWRARSILDVGMAVDGDVGNIGQQPCGTVAAPAQRQEAGRIIDKLCCVAIGDEVRMSQHIFEKREIRSYAANAVLAQRPGHAGNDFRRPRRPSCDLFQQGVIVPGDDSAGIGSAAVDTHPIAKSAAIGSDPAVVGDEAVLGVFGRDPALQGMTVEADVLLRRNTGLIDQAEPATFRYADLCFYDVNVRNHFGHGMLDLDARVDLDKVEFAAFFVDQELDGAGPDIIGRFAYSESSIAQSLTSPIVQVGSGRTFYDLLVAPLD